MEIKGQEFVKQEIHLDFNRFSQCHFRECTMIFHGFGIVHFDDCRFMNVRWTFADAAFRTLDFMAALYQAGAAELIESMIERIRNGVPPHPPVH